MEIRNLITFLRVAEVNSFTKAAQLLDYSQSTVSFQIKQLETELDCLLFERINHTLVLTGEGKALLEYAQRICRITDEFHQQRAGTNEISGHIHVVGPDSLLEAMLMEHYEDFYRQYPGISLRFSTADTENMFRLLDRNEADIMLTLDSHVYETNYIIAKEAPVSTHFFVGADSPLAKQETVTLDDVLSLPMILTEKGMGYRGVLDDMLARKSIVIEPVLEIGRTDIITGILERGDTISFLPDFVARKKLAQGKLKRLDVVDFKLDIWRQLIYHRNKWISGALAAFINFVSQHEFLR